MSIEFNCNACGKLLRVPEGSAGKQARCPHCSTVMRIPTASSGPFETESSQTDTAAPGPETGDPFGASGADNPFDDPLGLSGQEATGQRDALGQNAPGQNPFAEKPTSSPYDSPTSGGGAYGQPVGNYGFHPNRAGTVLTLGIISVVSSGLGVLSCCCGCFAVLPIAGIGFGIPAWIMGKADLEKMTQGIMDPTGYSNTKTGMTTGMIGTILGAIMLIGTIVLVILNLVFNIGAGAFQNNGF